MNLGVSSYICSAGLKAVTSAGSLGPYFALKYFVPFYDYRIDKTICREISGTTSATSISALNLVSATNGTLFGEKIFANTPYELSDTRFLYWTSNMGSLPEGITNNNVISQQSVSTDVNLLFGKPLSNTVSGTSVSSSATGYFTVTNTNVLSGTELTDYNPLSAASWPSSAFFKVASYSPNVNGITSATGSYKCRIPPGTGSFKFNGLAVYAVKVDNNGFDDSGNGFNVFNFNPTLFAVVLFDQAQYKQETVGGINDFEISLDLGFDWSTVSPGSSAIPTYVNSNYWIKLPTASTTSAYALNYDGDVVVSTSAVPGSWTPRAKLTVTDPQKGQLRLASDDSRFTDFRTIRFPIDLTGVSPNYNDRAVLAIDTSCPDDSLIQVGYKTSAIGIKSIAMGCNASATGYFNNGVYVTEDFSGEVDFNDIRNDSGGYTVSIGAKTLSQGFGSWAIGYNTSAIGYLNFAGGDSSIASYAVYNDAPFADQAPMNGLNFSFGKFTSAISRIDPVTGCGYADGSDYNTADDESYGSNVAFGVRTIANGGLSFVHGTASSATGMGSVSFGFKNLSEGCFAFTLGSNNTAKNVNSVAIGNQTSALSNFGLVFGRYSLVGNEAQENNNFCIAIGESVSATYSHAIALGKYALASNFNSIAIGQQADVSDSSLTVSTGINSIAIGTKTSATNLESISFGQRNLSYGIGSVAIGDQNVLAGNRSLGFGSKNISGPNGDFGVAIGFSNYVNGYYAFAMNNSTSATGECSFAGISNSLASGNRSIALGYLASATSESSIALGNKASSQHFNSIALGNNATTDKINQIVIGNCDTQEVIIRAQNINIGGNCGNVTIPGISQLNDGISFIVETVPLAGNDGYGVTFNIKVRKGISESILTMNSSELPNYTLQDLTVTSIKTDIPITYRIWGSDLTGSVSLGDKLYGSGKTFNYTDAVAGQKSLNANFLFCYDNGTNEFIVYVQSITKQNSSSISFGGTYDKSVDDLMSRKCFYNVIFDSNVTGGGSNAAIYHDFRWLKNCNIYSTYMGGWIYNSGKSYRRPMIFNLYNTDSYGSNGLFVFKLTGRNENGNHTGCVFFINDIIYANTAINGSFLWNIDYQASFMTVGKQSEYISLVTSNLG